MYIYLFIVFISTIIFFSHALIKHEKVNRITAFIWVVMMTFVVALQDNMGEDYSNYKELCRQYWAEPKEIFTIIILYPIHHFSVPDTFFFLVYAFLTYYYFSKFVLSYDRTIRFVMVMIMFQCIMFFQSFNLIRQILACSLFLYGSTLYFKGYKKSWLYLLFAVFVHETALFGILIMFLSKKVNFSLGIFLLYLISFFVFLKGNIISILLNILQPILNYTSYAHYYDVHLSIFEDNKMSFGIMYGFIFIMTLFLYIIRNKFENKGWGSILTCFILGQILFNLFSANVTLVRASYYSYFYIFLLFPLSVKLFKSNYRLKMLCFIYLIFFLSFYKSISDPNFAFVPYRNIIFNF